MLSSLAYREASGLNSKSGIESLAPTSSILFHINSISHASTFSFSGKQLFSGLLALEDSELITCKIVNKS